MIALVAAVPLETEILRRSLSPCEVRNCARRDLFLGPLFGHSVALLHCGVGKAAAAASVTSLVEMFHPSSLIVFGCAGAYPGSSLAVGDLALATEEIYGDEGSMTPEGFRDLEFLGLPLVERNGLRLFNRFPVDPSLLKKARPFLEQTSSETGRALVSGPFVTVSTCSGTDSAGREMAVRTGGICENMEGAAAAQVCALHGVPFLEVRGISNLAEDRDITRWDLKRGAEIAQIAVCTLLKGWYKGKDLA
ncbi:MAG: futalosine hydrolase [Desulfuromonadales bacterium]|jgi:futalosine hydrolase